MTTATIDGPGSPGAVQAQARRAYQEAVAAGRQMSGDEVGRTFGRSGRWGRDRIAECRPLAVVADAVADAVAATPLPVAATPLPVAATQSWNARMIVWVAFLLGIGASVAANVAHAQPQWGPRAWGAFVPVALLLAVEVMSQVAWPAGWVWRAARYGGVGLVAAVTAVMSYRHISGLLIRYGEDDINATIGPLAVDGLMVVAGAALMAIGAKRRQSHG